MIEEVAPEYRAVQRRLARGWNTWDTRSLLSQVRLPDAVLVSLGLKEYYRGTTLRHVQLGRREEDAETVTLGPHAVDGSYTELTVEWRGVTLRVRSAHAGDDLVLLVEPLTNQPKSACLTVAVAYAWNAPGAVRREGDSVVAESAAGATPVFATAPSVTDPYTDVDTPHLVLELTGPVGISTGRRRPMAEIESIIVGQLTRLERATSADVHRAIIRDAIAWNTIYEPAGARVVTTVSRLWNVGKRGGFALFCWDAFFGALLAGTVSADLAYANAMEMLAEATPEGFVPNVAQGTGRKTFDGSQPPVGALACWELYRAHGDAWFLRAAFPRLLAWNRWWWRVRRSGELLALGSTSFVPDVPSPQDVPRIHQHFGATCESGCDDHPVFADVPFDAASSLLRAHDIGLNSEYILDCELLAKMAAELGAEPERRELEDRRAAVTTAVRDRLWDDGDRIFRSHFSDTGRPTAYLSPMSFYPMLAGIAGPDQIRALMAHLRDPEEFGGQWAVPVTPRNDGRDVQGYWAGRVWPPVNLLVYLGLLRSGRTEDRQWLAERSAALVVREWELHRHVHENYSAVTGNGCDFPDSEPFYSWGALLSLIPLIEDGRVPYFADWR
ncbi:MGH1-like glycoside hydrolase domain-containing protein [Jiangella rhizosphaerae]|uniref:Mannosylglycerate hydrolase MGH1-like glycoside hydrolase domain-containing protein n=1 Tax=Jiangella rhizosphaerae TaxID=2293569 RepID=A0A418KG79_9ACTN|nr:trehalase family glycosidase [Jiangella rhizosphaerae]RIQ10843.1 hypothetical protein DY240_31150 [Jiangella rhizosphaerae]